MKIIFMGTPDFAVASLRVLVENNLDVVAVITAPDKPAGRGQKLRQTPVKIYAEEHGIPVLQPERLKNPDFLLELKSYQADLQIVVAFRMLPEVVWDMPPMGTFNLHGSLLPQYRGAAPINWAIINGEKETGVTTFFLEKEIDTGNIIFAEKCPIEPEDTAGSLHDKLMNIGAELVLKTTQAIANGQYPQLPQEEVAELKPAPKIFKEDCLIDWSKNTADIINFIRGLSPYPAAFTYLQDKTLKVFNCKKVESGFDLTQITETPQSIFSDGKSYLAFQTADGPLFLTDIQLEGKKRMKIEDFLKGYRF